MPPPSLPVEIYQLIIAQVSDPADLFTLQMCSRLFQREAERGLYQTLDLRPQNSIEQLAYKNLMNVISETPRLAPLIRDLTFMDSVDVSNGNDYATVGDVTKHIVDMEYWHSFSTILGKLTNLKVLRLLVGIEDDFKLNLGWVFRNATCQLTHLCIHFDCDDDVVDFLNTQLYITHLTLDFWTAQHSTLSLAALPHLSTLTGGSDIITRIVPGRPVVSITCDYIADDYFFEDLLFPSVKAVKLLDLKLELHHLRMVSGSFPSLVFLSYVAELNDGVIEMISSFARLQHLQLYLFQTQVTRYPDLVLRLFTNCRSLLVVELGMTGADKSYSEWMWRRGGSKAVAQCIDGNLWQDVKWARKD